MDLRNDGIEWDQLARERGSLQCRKQAGLYQLNNYRLLTKNSTA
jgi:hypothetical protein